jgi:hypothetical protein
MSGDKEGPRWSAGKLTLPNGGVILRSGVLGIFEARILSANGKVTATALRPPVRMKEMK